MRERQLRQDLRKQLDATREEMGTKVSVVAHTTSKLS